MSCCTRLLIDAPTAFRIADSVCGRFALIYGALIFAQYFVLGMLAFGLLFSRSGPGGSRSHR
jgi:hypothetical protein